MPEEGKTQLNDEQRKLVAENIPLVYYVSQKYRHIPEPAYQDLVGRLYLRLCKSIIRFDKDKGFKISSFLVKSLEGEIKNYFRDDVWPIKPPRPIREKAFTDIARSDDFLGTTDENADTVRSCTMPVSIDSITENGDNSIEIPDSSYPVESRVIDTFGSPQILREVFQCLKPEERTILSLRMKGKPLSEVQSRFRISKSSALEVWNELQGKVKKIYYAVLEGDPIPQSEGNSVLNQELLQRFIPPKSTSIALRKEMKGIKI